MSASLEHACLQSFTKVLDSPCHRFLRKVIPNHLQSCAMLLDCWWLTVVFILSTRLQNCNADYLRYQFNSETCQRRYLTDAMILSFNRMALQLTAHATQDWLHATAVTLLRSMNGHQTRQILICLIIMYAVPRWKPITSWTSISHQQLRSFKQDWRRSGMTFLRDLWQIRAVQNFRKRLQTCVFKAGEHFQHLMWLTLC